MRPTTKTVSADLTVAYDVHSPWTEAYVGIRHIIYELLPAPGRKLSTEQHALCQLALIGANHLMEVGLYQYLQSRAGYVSLSAAKKTALRRALYFDMLKTWVPDLAGWQPVLSTPPFRCTERLRRRRNDTIHKTSAKANVPMCRAAIYSATAGTAELWRMSSEPFPYARFLSKYPLPDSKRFSEVGFP